MKQELHSRGSGESRLEFQNRISNPARDAELPKLQALRDAAALSVAHQSSSTMQSVEWARMPTMTRVVILLMAGIDGENETLAVKSWREFNLPEQAGIQSAMRQLRGALLGAQALCRS